MRTYLDNASRACGNSEKEMLAVLYKSGLKTHGELRSHAMEALGLGHAHANAQAAYFSKPEWQSGSAAVKKATPKNKAPAKREMRLLRPPPATTPAS